MKIVENVKIVAESLTRNPSTRVNKLVTRACILSSGRKGYQSSRSSIGWDYMVKREREDGSGGTIEAIQFQPANRSKARSIRWNGGHRQQPPIPPCVAPRLMHALPRRLSLRCSTGGECCCPYERIQDR